MCVNVKGLSQSQKHTYDLSELFKMTHGLRIHLESALIELWNIEQKLAFVDLVKDFVDLSKSKQTEQKEV